MTMKLLVIVFAAAVIAKSGMTFYLPPYTIHCDSPNEKPFVAALKVEKEFRFGKPGVFIYSEHIGNCRIIGTDKKHGGSGK